MNFLHNNYMRSSGAGDTWTVEIDPANRPVKTYFEEACIAAEMIWAQKQGQLYVTYSGGLDSEFVLSVFLHMGMDIKPVIMNLNTHDGISYNSFESKYAYDFCASKNIKPIVVDLNFDEFVQSGQMLSIAEPIKCSSISLPASMWLVSQLDGTVMTGNDPPHLKLNQTDNKWYLDEEELIHTQFRYWKNNNVEGTPFFLSYTPELMLSFLVDPTIEQLANHKFPGKLGTNSSKVHVFNNGNDFNLVQRTKRTGYEMIFRSDIFKHPDCAIVNSWQPLYWGTSDHQYHDAVQKLSNGIVSVGVNPGFTPKY
jgi:hypothetical protein